MGEQRKRDCPGTVCLGMMLEMEGREDEGRWAKVSEKFTNIYPLLCSSLELFVFSMVEAATAPVVHPFLPSSSLLGVDCRLAEKWLWPGKHTGVYAPQPVNQEKSGILRCMRNDIESCITLSELLLESRALGLPLAFFIAALGGAVVNLLDLRVCSHRFEPRQGRGFLKGEKEGPKFVFRQDRK